VEPQPGHTPGSLVVWLGHNEVALVGDMILGGYLGGAFFAEQAGEHYYHDDPQQNRRNIERLVERGARRILVGHGGPVQPGSVRQAFAAPAASSSQPEQ
jgi:glyoxylase-like metal-dependent hydrolase (beta-lactamase superfamily II)